MTIPASPADVWSVLTDFNSYRLWNPFLIEMAGTVQVGSHLQFVASQPNGETRRFNATVITCTAASLLHWRGSVGSPLLLRADHAFRLDRHGDATELVHEETFRGIAIPLMSRTIDATRDRFREMDAALRAEVEARTNHTST